VGRDVICEIVFESTTIRTRLADVKQAMDW